MAKKKTNKRFTRGKQKTERVFDSIVRNAIDFLETSLAELETRPKYSVINFYSAIELGNLVYQRINSLDCIFSL